MRPVLFSIAGFSVFSAPVFAGLASLAAFLFFRSFTRRLELSLEDLWGLILVIAIGVIGGALLFYAVLYNGGLAENLAFVIRNKRVPGGSFWGSFWTAFACAYFYCRARGLDFRLVADAFGLSALLGLFVMRIGCFLHGCCYGAETAVWWSVSYADPRCAVGKMLLGKTLHPSQLYEASGSLAIFLTVGFLAFRGKRLKPGAAFVLSLAAYAALRFIGDFFRGGDPGILQAWHLTTAQYISAACAAGSVLWYRRL